jgi:hypothetical protein
METPEDIVAQATITFDTKEIVFVEIKRQPSFHNFYTVYRFENGKKIEVLGCLNQGQANDLEEAAKKIAGRWSKVKRKVESTEVIIYLKEEYLRLLKTEPSKLGLAKVKSLASIPGAPGPARLPIGYITLQQRMDILNPRKKKGGV